MDINVLTGLSLFFIFIFLEPNAGPVNVGAIAVSSTAINVTWGDVPLYQRNGIILGYRVSWYMYCLVCSNIKKKSYLL